MYDQKKRERRKRRVDEIRGEEEESAAGKSQQSDRGYKRTGGTWWCSMCVHSASWITATGIERDHEKDSILSIREIRPDLDSFQHSSST